MPRQHRNLANEGGRTTASKSSLYSCLSVSNLVSARIRAPRLRVMYCGRRHQKDSRWDEEKSTHGKRLRRREFGRDADENWSQARTHQDVHRSTASAISCVHLRLIRRTRMTSISSLPSATRMRTRFSPSTLSAGTNPTLSTAFLTADTALRTLGLLRLSGLSSSCTPFRTSVFAASALPFVCSNASPSVPARLRVPFLRERGGPWVGRRGTRWDCVRRDGGAQVSSSAGARVGFEEGAKETPGAP